MRWNCVFVFIFGRFEFLHEPLVEHAGLLRLVPVVVVVRLQERRRRGLSGFRVRDDRLIGRLDNLEHLGDFVFGLVVAHRL